MFKKTGSLGIPLLFILPIAGFLTALFNIRSKSSAMVYVGFAMLFGYAISFLDSSADSYRYAQAFGRFDNTLDYNTIVQLYRSGELRDLYRVLLFYFSSFFSDNPKVMYAFAGLVYGIFSYLSLLIFVRERGNIWNQYVFVLTLVFYTYISLSGINGFKFNTGFLVLFCALYNFFIQKKKVWVIGILITPLFHYGFTLVVPLLLLYAFIHPKLYNSKGVKPVLFYMFIATFFASWFLKTNSINLSFFTQSDALSGAVGSRLDFVNSDLVTQIVDSRKGNSLFLSVQTYFNYAIKIYIFISILFLNKLLKRMKDNKKIRTLILYAIPVFSFNIAFTNFMLPLLILTPTFWYGNIFWIIIEGLGFHI